MDDLRGQILGRVDAFGEQLGSAPRHNASSGHQSGGSGHAGVAVFPAVFHLGDAANFDHSQADLVVNMVPGSIGHEVLKGLHAQGHRIVDLSFSETTPDVLPAGPGTVLWDVGIAPGLSNMLVALAHREHGHLDSVTIKVGGNPAEPDEAWSYMAPFSPHDVIAEYTRPARVVREGTMTVVPAMDDLHTIDASGRTMEAFLTDGLRSLTSIPATSMGKKPFQARRLNQ